MQKTRGNPRQTGRFLFLCNKDKLLSRKQSGSFRVNNTGRDKIPARLNWNLGVLHSGTIDQQWHHKFHKGVIDSVCIPNCILLPTYCTTFDYIGNRVPFHLGLSLSLSFRKWYRTMLALRTTAAILIDVPIGRGASSQNHLWLWVYSQIMPHIFLHIVHNVSLFLTSITASKGD